MKIFLAIAMLFFAPPDGNAQHLPPLTGDQLLDSLQYRSFHFFWDRSNPANGLMPDRSAAGSDCSIASVGFGLTSLCVGIDHGWVGRADARDRVLAALKTFWNGQQGTSATGTIGYKGFFYHFLNMSTATRSGTTELSSIDTALLLAGILYCRNYFSDADSLDAAVRTLADSIYDRVDWKWMTNGQYTLTMGWEPESGFLASRWIGYNEAMIMYILGLGSPTHAVDPNGWKGWAVGYRWQTYYGFSYIVFAPLFGHQYSHCWIDFRAIADPYVSAGGITYFENSRRATLANRAYCTANPGGFTGYSSTLWGLTASDGPTGYAVHGAPPAEGDDGTIAPTAAAGSIPFAPTECLAALQAMYAQHGDRLWGQYGFIDAFNLSKNWYDSDVIGIDEGPIVLMIENYRTESVWNTFRLDSAVQRGLTRAGFAPVTAVAPTPVDGPVGFAILDNYPNPFNPSTTVVFTVPREGKVSVKVYNALGALVATLVDGTLSAGEHRVRFTSNQDSSGVYYVRLTWGSLTRTRKMILLR